MTNGGFTRALSGARVSRRLSHARALIGAALLLAVGIGSAPALAQNVTVTNGSTFDVTVNPTTINSLNINPGGTVQLHANGLFVTDNGVDTTWAGLITGVVNQGTLFKTGSGTVTFQNLTATNSEVHIDGGKAVQNAGVANDIRYLTIGSDLLAGEFDVNGGTLTIEGPTCPCFPALQVGDFGGVGVVNQTGGTVSLVNAALNIGNQGGFGTYNISGGSLVLNKGGFTFGRSPNSTRNSTGILNLSGTGVINDIEGDFVIGNNNPGGGAASSGTLNQMGGTFHVGPAGNLYIQGYNSGTYNLTGGTLEIGGTSFHGERYVGFGANVTGIGVFNFGGGTVKVVDSLLNTNVNANLLGSTSSTVDTNGLGANWTGFFYGSGDLVKSGAGTLTLLSPSNSYTGGTKITGGTLAIGAGSNIQNSSGVNLANAGTHFDISAAGGTQTIRDLAAVGLSFVDLGGNSLLFGTSHDTTIGAMITGAGGIGKLGSGVVTLTAQSPYSGPTAVGAGTLRMGVANAFTNTSLVLLGNQAEWDLGGAGPQHITGSFQMLPNPVLSMTLGNGHDVVNADTTAILAGLLNLHGGNGNFDPNVNYVVVNSAGLAGTFGSVVTDTPFLTPTAHYTATNAYLTFAKSGQTFAFVAKTPNEAAVGGALDPLPLTNPLYAQLATLQVPDALKALDQLSGDFHASTKSLLIQTGQYLADAAGDRIDTLANGGGAGAPMAYADDGKSGGPAWPGSDAPKAGPGIWVQGYGHVLKLGDGTGNAGLVNGTQYGVLGGVDGGSDNFLVGLGGGYSNASFNSSDRNATGTVQGGHILAYAGGELGMLRISGGGAYSFDSIATSRTISLPTAQTLVASYKARTAQAFGEIGAQIGMFEPFAGANYINVATDAFAETGGTAALTSAASTQGVTFATLGVRAESDAVGGAIFRGMAGWRHAFGTTMPTSALTIQGAGYTVSGVPVATDAFVAEAGVDVNVSSSFTVGAAYSGQIGANAQDHGAKGTATVKF